MDPHDNAHEENPAVDALMPSLSPAALMEIAEDPDNAAAVARVLWYEQQMILRSISPTLAPAQRLEWSKSLQKVGRLENVQVAQAGQGSGFSITINIPQVGATPPKTVTLESTAQVLAPDEDELVDE